MGDILIPLQFDREYSYRIARKDFIPVNIFQTKLQEC